MRTSERRKVGGGYRIRVTRNAARDLLKKSRVAYPMWSRANTEGNKTAQRMKRERGDEG